METQKIKLVIGLGNPDKKYENTYHNVGHQFVSSLHRVLPKPSAKEEGRLAAEAISSSTFMNQSGLFVKEQLKKHKIKPENLLIVHDDSDLLIGNYKLSFDRGSAGHRGVQNIIDQIKTKKIWRLRIGTRSPREKTRTKADSFVLKKISPTNKKKLEATFAVILNSHLSS